MENKFEEDYIERYVKKTGLIREKNPKSFKQIHLDRLKIFVNFGDLSSSLSFGHVILPKIIDSNQYNIVLTWKGTAVFFPCADEVWYLDKGYILGDFYSKAKGLSNESTNIHVLIRSLNEHFLHVSNFRDYKKYFTYHVTNNFLDDFKTVNYKPVEPLTLVYLPTDFKNKYVGDNQKRCVIIPFKHVKNIENGVGSLTYIDQFYYIEIINKLVEKGWDIFCVQNGVTYDVSSNVENSSVTFIKEDNFYKIISMINHCGIYFDFFADMGLLGLLSMAHVFRVSARSHYFNTRKYFEDMMFRNGCIIRNFFTFLYFGRKDTGLNDLFFDNIINQFEQFFDLVQEQKSNAKTVIEDREINLAEISKLYVKKMFPKFISINKEPSNEP